MICVATRSRGVGIEIEIKWKLKSSQLGERPAERDRVLVRAFEV